MSNHPQLEALVIESVQLLAEDFEIEGLASPDGNTLLYGADAPLDSMALVNLIADIEDAVSAQLDATITLADEKAMSAKNSPFRSVGSLVNAIAERIEA